LKVDGDLLSFESAFNRVGEVSEEGLEIESTADLTARLPDGALEVVLFSIDVTIERPLDPALERLKYNSNDDRQDEGFGKRNSVRIEA
jgi:hypothetical protein